MQRPVECAQSKCRTRASALNEPRSGASFTSGKRQPLASRVRDILEKAVTLSGREKSP